MANKQRHNATSNAMEHASCQARNDNTNRNATPLGSIYHRNGAVETERRTITDLDPSVFMGLAALDGATVTDRFGRLLAAGAILRHPPSEQLDVSGGVEGARTTAAMAASQFGPVLKVSEDGVITFFDRGRVWDI